MRLRLLLLVILISCYTLGNADTYIFTKEQKSYPIECTGLSSGLVDNVMFGAINDFQSSNPTNVAKIDSIITVRNQGDTLAVFIAQNKFVAYCYAKSGVYQLSEVLTLYDGEILYYINYLDVNNDNELEFISVTGNGINDRLYVHTYHKYLFDGVPSSSFANVIEQVVNFPNEPNNDSIDSLDKIGYFRISHNKFYIIHGYSQDSSGSYLYRYGTLDYTRDKEREIYFKPISSISLKRWKRL